MRSITTIAAAAAIFATQVAAGSNQVSVINNCGFPIYAWAVDADNWADGTPMKNPLTPETIAQGQSWSQTMHKLQSGGVSIKLAKNPTLSDPMTQLEYTLEDADTWYDISNVNCHEVECPFQPHGMYMESGNGCPTVSCVPGLLTCHGAYTFWNDDWASLCCTHAQDPNPDIKLYLCSDSPSGGYEPPVSPPSVTYEAKKPKPKPTPVEPATQVVEVTEVSIVMVTVTPSPRPYHERRSRHVHNHAHAHHF